MSHQSLRRNQKRKVMNDAVVSSPLSVRPFSTELFALVEKAKATHGPAQDQLLLQLGMYPWKGQQLLRQQLDKTARVQGQQLLRQQLD
jgi:hypothetical protein